MPASSTTRTSGLSAHTESGPIATFLSRAEHDLSIRLFVPATTSLPNTADIVEEEVFLDADETDEPVGTTRVSSVSRVLSELRGRNSYTDSQNRRAAQGMGVRVESFTGSVSDAKEIEAEQQAEEFERTRLERELQWALVRVDALPSASWNGFVASVEYEYETGPGSGPWRDRDNEGGAAPPLSTSPGGGARPNGGTGGDRSVSLAGGARQTAAANGNSKGVQVIVNNTRTTVLYSVRYSIVHNTPSFK